MTLATFAVLVKAYETKTKRRLSLKTYKGSWRLDRRGDQGVFLISDTLNDLAEKLNFRLAAS